MSPTANPAAGPADPTSKRGRASARAAFTALVHGRPDEAALADAVARRAEALAAEAPSGRRSRAVASGNAERWVPIGPSTVRLGEAGDRPPVTGRVRDLAVSPDGRRAYAATAKGGVWYTRDGGSTWLPVGGWASGRRTRGGTNNVLTCGALLVDFHATDETLDRVLVGTGELQPNASPAGWTSQGGIGVLASRDTPWQVGADDPWLPDTGLAGLEGLGVYRLARHPDAHPRELTGPNRDRVLAATTNGVWLGEWKHLGSRDGYEWSRLGAFDNNGFGGAGAPYTVSDVVWLPGGADGVLVYAIPDFAICTTHDLCATVATMVDGLAPGANESVDGRLTLARGEGTVVWGLGELLVGSNRRSTRLWRIDDPANANPVATRVRGLPDDLWPGQNFYDQALAVERVGGVDRIYVGGSKYKPTASANWGASLWCYQAAPAATTLSPAAGVSRTGQPSAATAPGGALGGGDGADIAGLIGNTVHADVHAIRLAGDASPNRQVWVGCDGGVFVSFQDGRVNTFAPRNAGLASLEPIFTRGHPTSSQFAVVGCQDNGAQVRVGDTVWEEVLLGDGGGCAFHPLQTDLVMTQYTLGAWFGSPSSRFRDPMSRTAGGAFLASNHRESSLAFFYSGMAVTPNGASARTAIGTYRAWVSDQADRATTWVALPVVAAGTALDARPSGGDPANRRALGQTAIGAIITMRWDGPNTLLALHYGGVVTHTNTGGTAWAATTRGRGTAAGDLPTNGSPPARDVVFTDLALVPGGGGSYYLTCLGDAADPTRDTVVLVDPAAGPTGTVTGTGLRRQLDTPADAVAGTPRVDGPLDPAYAVVTDPRNPTHVYVGTATGVWRGVRGGGGAHTWTLLDNGLPQATVQDLDLWVDPAPAPSTTPIALLRAGVQSRGVWELAVGGSEPRRTWVRAHARDDRRRLPTPLADPRQAPGTPDLPLDASPDITVRPRWPRAAAPAFTAAIVPTNPPRYELWTFQTAFRWRYPHVRADGRFSRTMQAAVVRHRVSMGLSAQARIDAAVWNDVVGGTRLDGQLRVRTDGTGDLAVYRAPWHTPLAPALPAGEADLLDLVHPVNDVGDGWNVRPGPVTVDVLLHHRDTRAVPASGAFAVLFWTTGADRAAVLAKQATGVVAALPSSVTGPAAVTAPTGWLGAAANVLPTTLDARTPQAVTFDIDLHPGDGPCVGLLAVVGSSADTDLPAPPAPTVTLGELVRAWPRAALRTVTLVP